MVRTFYKARLARASKFILVFYCFLVTFSNVEDPSKRQLQNILVMTGNRAWSGITKIVLLQSKGILLIVTTHIKIQVEPFHKLNKITIPLSKRFLP